MTDIIKDISEILSDDSELANEIIEMIISRIYAETGILLIVSDGAFKEAPKLDN